MAGAWYVGSARWRRQWRRVVVLGLIAGIVGGAVLGALAGARRSTSAYDRLARSNGTPHEVLFVFDRAPEIEQWLETAPGVDRHGTATGMIGRRPPQQDWYSIGAIRVRSDFPERATLVEGRMPRDDAVNEAYITLRTSQNTGLQVGDTVKFRAYGRSQTDRLLEDPWTVASGEPVNLRIVGIARDPSDAQLSQTIKLIFATPAFANRYASNATFTMLFVWLKGGIDAEPEFERNLAAFARTLGDGGASFDVTPSRDDKTAADRSSSAVATGLVIFAIVAGLAGLVTLIPLTRRSLGSSDDEDSILSSLGARHADRALAQFVATLPFLIIGTVVAVLIAYLVSPLFPLGATRALEPTPGLRVDLPVLVLGGAIWLLLLGTVMLLVAWTSSTNRARTRAPARSRRLELGTAAKGNPTTVGVRFAIQPGTRRSALHRSALVGVVVAIIGVVSCIGFTKSVDEFTTTPTRFGIDFDAWIEVPTDQAPDVLDTLAADRDLTAVAESRSGTLDIGGRRTEAYGIKAHKGDIQPTLLAGTLPAHDDEIALGPKLLSSLHKQIGDTATIHTRGTAHPMKIVGTVLAPASESNAFNAEAVLTADAVNTYAELPVIQALARIHPGADADAVFARLDQRYPYGISDESRPHAPGPVKNLDQIRRLPLVLALFFLLLGAVAIAQSIVMTAHEHRRDLSVLRVIGYTRHQIGAVLRGVAAAIALVGIVIGVPVGLVAARIGWRAVAEGLAVDQTTAVPLLLIGIVSIALIAFALVVALVPTHLAVRRTPGAALRSE